MQCEVCGRKIIGEPKRVIIEGAKMTTCSECAKLGSGFWSPEQPKTGQRAILKKTAKPMLAKPAGARSKGASGSTSSSPLEEEVEVVEGFGSIIKQAREKMGLTPEDLGRKIGEKESVVKKVEGEKIVPDIRLAVKLEHALKIKLLKKASEPKIEGTALMGKPRGEPTLGEIVYLRGSKGRNLGDEDDNSST